MARCLPKIKTDSLLITLVLWVSLTWAERNHSQNSVVKNQLEENATDQETGTGSWKRGFRTVSNHKKYLKSLLSQKRECHKSALFSIKDPQHHTVKVFHGHSYDVPVYTFPPNIDGMKI